MRLLLPTGGIFIFVCAGIVAYTWYRLRKSLRVHTNENQELIQKYPLKHKEVFFTTKDGFRIAAWYMPVTKPKAVIILLPGFTETNGGKALMLPHADYLQKQGYSTLLIDFRSNGDSPGNKVTLGVTEWHDVEAAYDYASKQPENKGVKIGYFGISMGASTAVITTGKTGKGDFVIASVPFASYSELFAYQLKKEHLPNMLFLPFLRLAARIELGPQYDTYDPSKWITHIHVPIFIMAAKRDGDVGYDQPTHLYTIANAPKILWAPDAQHDIHLEKPKEFQSKILSFLNEIE